MTNPEFIQSVELKNHLRLCPFVSLPLYFDHESCFTEARALLEKFVVHRPYDQAGVNGFGWKSLALRALGGDSTKTEYHTVYNETSDRLLEKYRNTDIMDRCPEVRTFLENAFDVDRCYHIRFLLLEPGATFRVHRDEPNSDLDLAVNIALNHPKDCDFYIDLNPDGSENEFTQRIPFQPGRAFWVNVAKYHSVTNRSQYPRIHMIVHGPLRLPESEVLMMARKQNGIGCNLVLCQRLVQKHVMLNDLDRHPHIMQEFKEQGWTRDVFPDDTEIVIAEDSSEPVWLRSVKSRATLSNQLIPHLSLFQKEPETIFLNDLLRLPSASGFRETVCFRQGLHFLDPFDGILKILELIRISRDNGRHIFVTTSSLDQSVSFNQCAFLVVNRRRGLQSLRSLIENPSLCIPVKELSDDIEFHVHPSCLLVGNEEFHTSPEVFEDLARKKVQDSQGKIFYFNNEPLKACHIPGFEPKRLVTLASGLKFSALLAQYWRNIEPREIWVVDKVSKALSYLQDLGACKSLDDVARHVHQTMLQQGQSHANFAYVKESLKEEIQRYIGSEDLFLEHCRLLKKARFLNVDLLTLSRSAWAEILVPDTIFWHSNMWTYSASFYQYSREQLMHKFKNFIGAIKQTYQLHAWLSRTDDSVVFGKSLEEPSIFAAAAGDPVEFSLRNFSLVTDPLFESSRAL